MNEVSNILYIVITKIIDTQRYAYVLLPNKSMPSV